MSVQRKTKTLERPLWTKELVNGTHTDFTLRDRPTFSYAGPAVVFAEIYLPSTSQDDHTHEFDLETLAPIRLVPAQGRFSDPFGL